MWVYPIRCKSNAFSTFQHFRARVENETGHTIVKFCTNHGGKFTSAAFKKYLLDNGIQHQFLTPYTPQQNGRAKRLNETILAGVRCMLIEAGMSPEWWAKAALTYAYIKNRLPHAAIGDAVPEHCTPAHHLTSHTCACLGAPLGSQSCVMLGTNLRRPASKWSIWDAMINTKHGVSGTLRRARFT
ncbi:hypothetical protein ACM66B_004070 [Microbotryomycetes sp. NB124-2]